MLNTYLKNKGIVFRFLLFVFAIIGLVFVLVFAAMQFGLLNVKGSISNRNAYFNSISNTDRKNISFQKNTLTWANTDEWNLMKEVFTRDKEIIKKAGRDGSVSPRLILASVIGEQFRFFTSKRESFKGYFEPMKILASLSKVSFGIAGIKPKTASQIEEHLKDKNSPFYLGSSMENILDYEPGVNIETEQMNRITDSKNSYYSYLYVGLFLKQVEAQWAGAGYDISGRPEILSTIYNLGFYHSIPKSDPQAGGAVITINGVDYTYGDLGYEFYYSDELSDIFPKDVK